MKRILLLIGLIITALSFASDLEPEIKTKVAAILKSRKIQICLIAGGLIMGGTILHEIINWRNSTPSHNKMTPDSPLFWRAGIGI